MPITIIDTIEPKTEEFKVVDAKHVGYNGARLSDELQKLNSSSPSQFSYCSGNKIKITKVLNVFSTEKSLSSSIYWPWLIKVEGLIENPLGKYYLYYSTDHGQTAGYISVAYSNYILGPFTDYGRIYKYGNTETETPSVMWDEYNKRFIMYVHCSGAYTGEAQTTYHITSTDGLVWSSTPTKTFDLDKTKLFGNLHNGYFHPFRLGNQWYGYSLMGGNNAGSAISYSEDGYKWVTDHNQLGYWCLKDSMYLPPHHGTIISKWGQTWWIGLHQNFASGTEAKVGSVVMVQMQDLYTPIGQPINVFELEDPIYENSNIRQVSVYQEGSNLYIWYQCGNYFNVAIMSEGETNVDIGGGGGGTDPTPDPDPVPTYTSLISITSNNTIDGLGTMRTWVDNPMKPGTYKFKVTINPAVTASTTDNTPTIISFKLASSNADTNGTELIVLKRSDCIDKTSFESEVQIVETRPYLYLYSRPFAIGTNIEILYKDYDSTEPEPPEETQYELATQFTTTGDNGITRVWLNGPFEAGNVYGIKMVMDKPIANNHYDDNVLSIKRASSTEDSAGENCVTRTGMMLEDLTTVEEFISFTEQTPNVYIYFRPYLIGITVSVYTRKVTTLGLSNSSTILIDTVSSTSSDTLGTIRKWGTNPLVAGKRYKLSFVLSAAIADKTQAADDNVKIFDIKYASSTSDNAGTSIYSMTKKQYGHNCVATTTIQAVQSSHMYLYFRPYTVGTNMRVYYEEV